MTRICNKIRRIVRKIRSKMNQGEVAKLLEMNHTTVHYIWKRYLCQEWLKTRKEVESQRFQQKETGRTFVDI